MLPAVDPLPIFLVLFLIAFVAQEKRYFAKRNALSFNLPVPSPSPEVMSEANRHFRVLRKTLTQLVMDVCGSLGVVILTLYAARMLFLGQESLSTGEMSHVVLLLFWQLTCAAFHTGVLKYGDWEIVFLMYMFNLLTIGLTLVVDEWSKPMLEPMIMMGRVVGCLAFLDWRHALCINLIFAASQLSQQLSLQVGQEYETTFVMNCVLTEFCVFSLIQVVPVSVQLLMQKWIAVVVAASDLDSALRAAKSVISSSCDAEAQLNTSLELQQVSPKLAHLFGRKPQDLEGKRILDFLDEEDRTRFEKCVKNSTDNAEPGGPPVVAQLSLTICVGGVRKEVEMRVCSLSRLGCGTWKYLLAISEVKNALAEVNEAQQEAQEEEGADTQIGEAKVSESSGTGLTAELLQSHRWASQGRSRNLSSLSEVKVQLDEQTGEIQNIQIFLNTNHWKKSRKTFLKECILPGIWEDFKRWMDGTAKGRTGVEPPFIVPFGFPRAFGGVACARNVEVKRKVGPTGRNELSLRLRHIFIRRPGDNEPQPQSRGFCLGHSGKGTPSVGSRGTL